MPHIPTREKISSLDTGKIKLDPIVNVPAQPTDKTVELLHYLSKADDSNKSKYNELISVETTYLNMAIDMLKNDELLQAQFGGYTYQACAALADIIKENYQQEYLKTRLVNTHPYIALGKTQRAMRALGQADYQEYANVTDANDEFLNVTKEHPVYSSIEKKIV